MIHFFLSLLTRQEGWENGRSQMEEIRDPFNIEELDWLEIIRQATE